MQSCTAIVVSVCKSGFGRSTFKENSDFDVPEYGCRFLYNRELGLISYNHNEESLGSWHEVEHFWKDDDGYGNGIEVTGACFGKIKKSLQHPLCETDGIVTNDHVHHLYSGTGIALDVEENYMTMWHDHLGLVVHFGEELDRKFLPLHPVDMKTQACAQHRLYGFHATRVSACTKVRLQNLYFAQKAKVEVLDNFLVAKCSNGHSVVMLDKRRALATEEEFPVGETISLAYFRIHTSHGPMFISGFVTNEAYFDEHFDSLCKTHGISNYLFDGFASSKSQVPRFSSSKLQKLCKEHLNCWNVDHADVSWYTGRFTVDSPTLIRKNEKEEEEEKLEINAELENPPEQNFSETEEKEEPKEAINDEEMKKTEDAETTEETETKDDEAGEKVEAKEEIEEVTSTSIQEDSWMETDNTEERMEEKLENQPSEASQKTEDLVVEKVEDREKEASLADEVKEEEKKEMVEEIPKVKDSEAQGKLEKEPSLAETTEREGEKEEKPQVSKEEFDEEKEVYLELDLGDLTDETLLLYDQCGEKEEPMPPAVSLPKAAEPVEKVDNKENHVKIKNEIDKKENKPAGMTLLPNPLQTPEKKSPEPIGLQLNSQSMAKCRVFKELGQEEMRNTFQEEVKRRAAQSESDLITNEKMMKRAREILDWQDGRENRSPGATSRAKSRSSGRSSVTSPIGGAPLGMGGQIPAGLMRPRSSPVTPPASSSSASYQKPPTPSSSNKPRRIGIVPRNTSTSNSGSNSSSGGSYKANGSFGSSSSPNIKYLDMGPLYQGESTLDYLDRVVGAMDSRESKATRVILNHVMDNHNIVKALKGYFPALYGILQKMYEKPNLVGLGALDLVTNDKNESSGSAQIDRISMECIVYELLKTKSRPVWDTIRNEIPFVNGF